MIRPGDVITHEAMCRAEGKYLQKGMNFRGRSRNSVFLMSRRKNALYTDRIEDEGRILVYEGHDIRKEPGAPDPKSVDQPVANPDGTPTDNGKFMQAALAATAGAAPLVVHVYEKIQTNIWVSNGAFELIDAWRESQAHRQVCKFKLRVVDESADRPEYALEHSRLIPPDVKVAVWTRDGGRCVRCGSTENLHFDHIIPFSKGGTSLKSENIQILCAKHNVGKGARIE